ncbi:MAG: glycosyltransferase family 4 protein [Deltaproteobacteria bacterium]
MKILFIHQNFPGQFRHLAPALAREGHELRALAISPRAEIPGVQNVRYAPARNSSPHIHPWARDFESKTIRADACGAKMLELRASGFAPDLVIGHPGWGETWLVKDVWPAAPLVCLQEFYYGADLNFDPEFQLGAEEALRLRVKNACVLPGLDSMDWGVSPTGWQRAQFPAVYRDKISVVFEGIDTDRVCPKPIASLRLGQPAITLHRGEEIVTFVNRNLEPYRGYHCFMRALPRLFELRPQARVVLVGGDQVGYGAAPPQGTWRQIFFDEVRARIDPARVHYVGQIPYPTLIDLFRISACHVYLTYPFVLSWSMFEAMSAGALVLGSRTGPLEEVLEDGKNGLLVDFFDSDALAARMAEALAHPERFAPLREAARRTVVERYALSECLPKQLALAHAVASGRRPALS